MSDIKISLKNYKKLKDWDQVYPNARILLVTGKNEIGKSSLIRSVIENMKATGMTDDPVTRGEKSGSVLITIPDKNGNAVTINHEFSLDNQKGTFYAIDHEGKKIKEVKKIRELIGAFEEMPIDKFYLMTESAEGRRKIIQNYFYPLIAPNDIQEINTIDQRTKKGGDIFDERTRINTEIDLLKGQLKAAELSEADNVLVDEYENIIKHISELKEKSDNMRLKINSRTEIQEKLRIKEERINHIPSVIKSYIEDVQNSVKENENEIKELEAKIIRLKEKNQSILNECDIEIEAFGQESSELSQEVKVLKENLENFPDVQQYDELKKSLESAETFRDKALEARSKKNNHKVSLDTITAKYARQEALDKEINELRERKSVILKNSKLPSGLSIEEDSFTWNGFTFADTQISKSSALLVISEILCNVVESKIVYLGERGLFDKERFAELIKLAHKYGKIPVLEQVIDDQQDIKVIYEVED